MEFWLHDNIANCLKMQYRVTVVKINYIYAAFLPAIGLKYLVFV